MANQKISDLTLVTPDGTEYVECIIAPYSPGTNRRITTQSIADLGGAGGGTVTSLAGTASRIAVDLTNPAVPVINIDPAYDAAITAEINAAVSGVEYKDACNYKTVAPLATNVYNNGSSGVGATLTGVAFGAISFDGVTPSIGDSVLVDQEVAGANNGIYLVTAVGGGAAVYVLTRRGDFNQSAEIEAGDATYILGGATKGNTTWVMTTTGVITVGTTALVFVQVQGIGSIPDASETAKGIIEIATQAETHTGTDDVRAITPLKLAAEKGATGGIVGMSGFSIAFKNLADTFTSLFQNAATAIRTYTFPDRDITIAGTDDFVGVQDLWIPAGAMQPRTTSGSDILRPYEMTTSLFNVTALAFDQTTQEFADFQMVLPRKYNNGTVTCTPYWTAQAGSGTVQWGISFGSYRNDDALTVAFGTPQTSDDALIATNDVHIGPATSAITMAGTVQDGNFIGGRISRNPASDTLSGDALLLGIMIHVTVDAGKDA